MGKWWWCVPLLAYQAAGLVAPPDPSVPARLLAHAGVQPLCKGFVDPTKPPYACAGDGVTDDSACLASASADAYQARMSLWLPGGAIFLLSRQLLLKQTFRSRSFGYQIGGGGGTAGVARPVLKLKDHTEVDDGVFVLYELVQTGPLAAHDEGEHYNSRFRGVDIDLGNNPTVSGLSMSGAQQCSIEDITIRGVAFRAGISGLPGSGGFSANVVVIGGDYGVFEDTFRPNPSISGFVAMGQRKAGLAVAVVRGPVVISAFRIESAPDPDPEWRAVVLLNQTASQDNAFCGEDGIIVSHASTGGDTAVSSNGGDVSLKNVTVSGIDRVVDCPAAGISLATNASSAQTWVHVPLFVLTVSGGEVYDMQRSGLPNVSAGHTATVYLRSPLVHDVPTPAGVGSLLPPSTHSWDDATLPRWWQSSWMTDVVLDYGATPQWVNDTDNDGARMQQAIDDVCDPTHRRHGFVVFVPHGEFNLARPLDLHGCASMLGAGTQSTVLQPLIRHGGARRCWVGGGLTGAVLTSTTPPPTTHKAGNATPTMPVMPLLVSDVMLITQPLCPFVDLRIGSFLLRDVGIEVNTSAPPPLLSSMEVIDAPAVIPTEPYFAIRDAVSGRFFGLPLDGIFGGANADNGGALHVLILVNGTAGAAGAGVSGGIHFYQPSTEHLVNDKQVLVADSANVHFHAWKYESSLNEPKGGPTDSGSLVRILRSRAITVFGGSGNYRLYNASVPMIDMRNSGGVVITGMVRKGAWNEPSGMSWIKVTRKGKTAVSIGGEHALLYYRSEN